MEEIKINLKTPVYGLETMEVIKMTLVSDGMLIVLGGSGYEHISEGDAISFNRVIKTEEEVKVDVSTRVQVTKKMGDNTILATRAASEKIFFRPVDGITVSEDGAYAIFNFQEPHNIFAQDIAADKGMTITIYGYDGKAIATYDDLWIPSIYVNDEEGAVIEDTLTEIRDDETCGKSYSKVKTYGYDFLPYKFSRKSLIVRDYEDIGDIEPMYAVVNYNPYYYYEDIDGELVCSFWGDVWKDSLTDTYKEKYEILCDSSPALMRNSAYWSTNEAFALEMDCDSLTEGDFSGVLEETAENAIGEAIDMERVKYAPSIDGERMATELKFNFHFRKRDTRTGNNSSDTKGNAYADGWYINPDLKETIWWNGMNYSEVDFSEDAFSAFLEASGTTSDLVGYLNFTDNDIFYRKKKVSESFVRLSFYTSTDPIDKKLLYYSTIFLDGGDLWGKYVNQLSMMEDEGLMEKAKNQNVAVVMCESNSIESRVDTKIVLTNEMTTTKSSEGFNLYLFRDDVDIKDIDEETGTEKEYRTIYMMVEFNHAGNGKTIPMIMWPKENGKYVPLTRQNFINSLYIPINIRYNINSRKYTYSIPDAINDGNSIELVLFEPKLTIGD